MNLGEYEQGNLAETDPRVARAHANKRRNEWKQNSGVAVVEEAEEEAKGEAEVVLAKVVIAAAAATEVSVWSINCGISSSSGDKD